MQLRKGKRDDGSNNNNYNKIAPIEYVTKSRNHFPARYILFIFRVIKSGFEVFGVREACVWDANIA